MDRPAPSASAQQALAECREQIDQLDRDILDLLNRRTKIVERIGSIKREHQLAIYEPKREEQVFANVLEHNGGPLPPEAVKRLFERIIDEMRTLQRMRLEQATQPTGTDRQGTEK